MTIAIDNASSRLLDLVSQVTTMIQSGDLGKIHRSPFVTMADQADPESPGVVYMAAYHQLSALPERVASRLAKTMGEHDHLDDFPPAERALLQDIADSVAGYGSERLHDELTQLRIQVRKGVMDQCRDNMGRLTQDRYHALCERARPAESQGTGLRIGATADRALQIFPAVLSKAVVYIDVTPPDLATDPEVDLLLMNHEAGYAQAREMFADLGAAGPGDGEARTPAPRPDPYDLPSNVFQTWVESWADRVAQHFVTAYSRHFYPELDPAKLGTITLAVVRQGQVLAYRSLTSPHRAELLRYAIISTRTEDAQFLVVRSHQPSKVANSRFALIDDLGKLENVRYREQNQVRFRQEFAAPPMFIGPTTYQLQAVSELYDGPDAMDEGLYKAIGIKRRTWRAYTDPDSRQTITYAEWALCQAYAGLHPELSTEQRDHFKTSYDGRRLLTPDEQMQEDYHAHKLQEDAAQFDEATRQMLQQGGV